MRLIYHPHAAAEIVEAAQYYEQQVAGLGASFLREFDAAIADIKKSPHRWHVVEEDVRRFVMHRFPYGIYYRFSGTELRVLVVKHHSRHPDYWKYRLG